MSTTQLYVAAAIWRDTAALVMEGSAEDRANGGGPATDALYRVALARGLRLTTDVVHLDPRPLPGWRVLVDETGAITLSWPHRSPLLSAVPLQLPPGWTELAADREAVQIFAGHGLGMREPGDDARPLRNLVRAAESGDVAAGAVFAAVEEQHRIPAARLPNPEPGGDRLSRRLRCTGQPAGTRRSDVPLRTVGAR